ncbi:MAG: hypothetical protein WD407_11370 [Rhodospirillales bacterium]
MASFKMNMKELRREIEIVARKVTRWSHDHLPPGVRSVAGVLFIIGGCFGFLPILGFWMIPVGVMLIMLDLPVLRHKVIRWMNEDVGLGQKERKKDAD